MKWRFLVLRVASIFVLLLLVGRLGQLQLIRGNQFRSRATQNTIRTDYVLPIRGEIYASDGKTLLGASEPSFHVAVRDDALPDKRVERQEVFSLLATLLGLEDALVISPTGVLEQKPELLEEIKNLTVSPMSRVPVLDPQLSLGDPTGVTTITLLPSRSRDGLALTRVYSQELRYHSKVQELLDQADLPRYLPVTIKTEIPREIALTIRENQRYLPGVQIIQGYRRSYPRSGELESISHLLGYTGKINDVEYSEHNPPEDSDQLPTYLLNDLIGKGGIELSYEQELRGQLGVRQIEVDNRQVTVGEPLFLRPVRNGNNVVLALDLELQRHAEAKLKEWLAESDRRRLKLHPQYDPIVEGVVIVIDVNTGAILASVSLPGYDNTIFSRPLTQADADLLFNDNKRTPMLNRAIEGRYPPGSTFKQVSAAAGLWYDVIAPDTKLHDPGILEVESEYVPGVIYRDYRNAIRGDRGKIDVIEALKNSSNVFFQQVIGGTEYVKNLRANDPLTGEGVGVDRFAALASEWFGLGQPSGIDLPGELSGIMPTRQWKRERGEAWSVGNSYNIAIGQGDVLVTPLQLVNVTATIANGGTRYRPHIAKAITASDGSLVRAIEPEALGQLPIDPGELQAIREGMYQSVHAKDSHNVIVSKPHHKQLYEQLRLAGKTGTAEYIEPNGRKRSHSWFVGYAPYEQPQIAVVAFLGGTGDLEDGSATLALPTVAEVMAHYFKIAPPPAPTPVKR